MRIFRKIRKTGGVSPLHLKANENLFPKTKTFSATIQTQLAIGLMNETKFFD